MAKSSTAVRAKQRQAENVLPGGEGCIQVSQLPPGSDVASLRHACRAHQTGPIQVTLPWMLQDNREYFARELANYRQERFNIQNREDAELYSDLIRRSLQDDQVRKELAAYRMFELQNDVIAAPFAFGAFLNTPLADDELPAFITPISRQYFEVRYIGQDGQARRDQIMESRQLSSLLMRMISTDKVEYPLYDIQLGLLDRASKVEAQLRFDMEAKLDEDAQVNLDAGKRVSGLRALLNIHPKVDPANIPDTNYLDLTAAGFGTTGVLNLLKVKLILSHIAKFGVDGISPEGGFQIASIVQSPQNLQDWWDFVSLVSGITPGAGQPNVQPGDTIPSGVRDQIFNTGFMSSAWGYNWASVPNARMPKGKLYVFSTQPVGWFFHKPNFDAILKWDGPSEQERNEGHIVYRRVVNFVMPDLWLHRFLIVDF